MVAVHDGGGGGTSIDYFDLHSPVGATIQTQGRSIQTLSGDVENFSTDVQSGHNRAQQGVSGLIADAMVGAPQGVITNANNFNAMITSGGGAVIVYGHAIDTFNELVTSLNNQLRETPEAERVAKRAELAPQYTSGQDTLRAAARTARGQLQNPLDPSTVQALNAAGGLPTSVQNLFPSVSFTGHEPTELPSDIAALSDEEQARYVREHPDFPPELAAIIDPGAQEILAEEVAQDIRDGEVDPETVRLMEIYQRQHPFTHELYSTVTPDELADTIRDMSRDAYTVNGQTQTQIEAAQIYSGFMAAAGVSMATYTKGTGAYAPPADLARQWSDAITDTDNPENAAALTILVRNGGETESFDPEFLSDLTSNVYEWERSHDGDPVWGPLHDDVTAGGAYRGIVDPGEIDPDNYRADGDDRFDGLANLLHAMENTPDAAEQFFADGGTTEFDSPKDGVDGVDVNDRLHYLLMEREWPTDDGDGLGEALVGATTHSRGNDAAGHESAELAGQAAFMIGQSVGENESFWNVDGTDGWQIPTGMRDDVGEMMSSYIPDVNRAANTDGETDAPGLGFVVNPSDGSPTGMALSADNLDAVLNSLGEGDDKKGLEYVSAAALTYHNHEIGEAMDNAVMPDGSRPQTVADLEDAVIVDENGERRSFQEVFGSQSSFGGNTMATILAEGFQGGKAGEAIDQEGREALGRAFGAATSFIPTPANAIAGTITSEGLSYLGDQISEQPDSVTDAWAENADEEVARSLRFGAYDHLLRNDLIDVGGPNGLPDGAVVTDDDGNRHIDPALYSNDPDADVDPQVQASFNQWVLQNGPSVYGQTQIDAYRSNFPQFGSD